MIFLYGSLVGAGHLITGRGVSGIAFLLLGLVGGAATLSFVAERPERTIAPRSIVPRP
jgi:hypothetical protein